MSEQAAEGQAGGGGHGWCVVGGWFALCGGRRGEDLRRKGDWAIGCVLMSSSSRRGEYGVKLSIADSWDAQVVVEVNGVSCGWEENRGGWVQRQSKWIRVMWCGAEEELESGNVWVCCRV